MGRERNAAAIMTLGGGAAAAVVCAVCLLTGRADAWLGAAGLCAAAPVGAVGLAMMIRLIPGAWRGALAPPLAVAPWLLIVAGLAMAPVLVAPTLFYSWALHPSGAVFRDVWLSQPWFLIRGLLWFALLAGLALRLRSSRGGTAAIAGLLVYVPFGALIAVDWLQSLDPAFSSSGFGLYVLAVQMGFALALSVAAMAGAVSARDRDVLGGVLLSATAIWAYLGFMQFFILWSADLPAGAAWFRRHASWAPLAWTAIALKAAPGASLIFGHVRRDPRALRVVALAVALGAAPELAWLTLPPTGAAIDLGLFAAAAAALAVAGLGVVGLARREAAA